MSAELRLLAANALFPLVGYALLYALGLVRAGRGGVRMLGLAYLAGWALLGTVLSLLLVVGVAPRIPAVVAAAAALVVVCVVVGRRRTPVPPPPVRPRPQVLGTAVAAAGAALVAIASVAAVVASRRSLWNAPSDWDAVWFWIPKAEALYWRGLDPDLWGSIAHPEYPPLAPVLHAATFHFAGLHPSLLPLQATLLGIAFLLAVLALLSRVVPSWLSFPSVALVATTPWFWERLVSPMPDQTVAYLLAVAALVLVLWLHEGNAAWLALAGVLLAAASLTKLEGAFFALLLVAVFAAAGLVLRGRAALPALWLLLAPAVLVPWRLWLARHDLPTSSDDYRLADLLHPGFLADRTERLTYALSHLASAAADTTGSALGGPILLALPFVAALVLAATRIPVPVGAAAAWVVLAFAGLAVVYWIGRPDIEWYVAVTIDRVQPTIVLVAATLFPLLVALALRAAPEPAPAAEAPAARARLARVAPAVAVALVLAATVAATRPASARTSEIDVGRLEQELASQFRLRLAADGFDYGVQASCRSLGGGDLGFNCHVATVNPADAARQPSWDLEVACSPWPGSPTQRCVSSTGDALY